MTLFPLSYTRIFLFRAIFLRHICRILDYLVLPPCLVFFFHGLPSARCYIGRLPHWKVGMPLLVPDKVNMNYANMIEEGHLKVSLCAAAS